MLYSKSDLVLRRHRAEKIKEVAGWLNVVFTAMFANALSDLLPNFIK